jgi:plastocyanin
MPMDPMKSRKWIAAAALAAAAVFLVMVVGESAPTAPPPAASSAEAVLTSEDGAADGDPSAGEADSEDTEVITALQQLLDELGINAEELVEEDAATADPASITIDNFAFGQPVTVAPGATVEVKNSDSATHNVTATDSAFETRNIAAGESATFIAPDAPGRYEFTCTLHPEMTGTLIVDESADAERRGGRDRNSGDTRSAQPGGSGPPSSSSRNGGGNGDVTDHRDRGAANAPGTRSGHGSGDGY